jgi:DNA-binding response OmpR family regulator
MPDKTILVVESEGEVARAISAALGKFDVGVEVVEDGKKMFGSAKSRPPALIVLRVELPGQSGYSICMKLRKEKELKDIPLILTSSEANEDTFESHRKLKVRADDYQILRSPVPTEELVEKIRALVHLEPAGDDLDVITLEDDEAITIEDEDAFSADELGPDGGGR